MLSGLEITAENLAQIYAFMKKINIFKDLENPFSDKHFLAKPRKGLACLLIIFDLLFLCP